MWSIILQGGSGSIPGAEKVKSSNGSGSPDPYEVVYVKDNVSVHPTQYASERISGKLRLIKQGASLFMVIILSSIQLFLHLNMWSRCSIKKTGSVLG